MWNLNFGLDTNIQGGFKSSNWVSDILMCITQWDVTKAVCDTAEQGNNLDKNISCMFMTYNNHEYTNTTGSVPNLLLITFNRLYIASENFYILGVIWELL